MPAWTPEILDSIQQEPDLYVSPFREDGTTYGTPTQTWALVVDGNVYVRAANGTASRWYQAAITQNAGRIRVAGTVHDARFQDAPDAPADLIDAAYAAKYAGSSAVRVMQGPAPTSATVLITPR
ncbi:DUF2255 family protein [Rathayibacter sp. AY1H3]|uniref:DUF2255 family protein n=1 Tax=Rathayibacter sp. AY1H3 TaxID=2080567 RepID=UPI000CE81EE0|nr:DUF2255 family protein [Rathayibacter sp. AY1H3]PPH01537.1 DUF2255 domain-containing protein [Rathayibacter sp. AY1H3]